MSSSTGKDYAALGAYNTRPRLARVLVDQLPWCPRDSVLEGHAGGAAFVDALVDLRDHGRIARVYANDINPEAPGLLSAAKAGVQATAEDFLKLALPPVRAIIGNPPYGIPQPEEACPACSGRGNIPYRDGTRSRECGRCDGTGRWTPKPIPVAEQHVRRALDHVAPLGGFCAFLLRAGFLLEARGGSQPVADQIVEATPLLAAYRPTILWGIEPRPSFYGSGNDSASYVWAFWDTRYRRGPTEFRWLRWRANGKDDPAEPAAESASEE